MIALRCHNPSKMFSREVKMMQRGHKGDNIWRSPSKNGKRCLNIILARVTHNLPLFGMEGMSQRRRRHLDTPYSRVRGAFVH